MLALAHQLGGLADGRAHARVVAGLERLNAPTGVVVIALAEGFQLLHAHLLPAQGREAVQGKRIAQGREGFTEQQQAVDNHVDDPVLIVQVRIGGHRQVGQQQAGQITAGGALLHKQAAFGAVAVLAFDVKIQPGLQVQLAALGLLA